MYRSIAFKVASCRASDPHHANRRVTFPASAGENSPLPAGSDSGRVLCAVLLSFGCEVDVGAWFEQPAKVPMTSAETNAILAILFFMPFSSK